MLNRLEGLGLHKRIVLIEDNVELRNAYELILKGIGGYAVVGTFSSCEEAIENLERVRPDLVMIDLTLPGMDGITGIVKIKKMFPQVKIIVVTVHDDSEHVFNALCAGAIGYLTKDSDHQEILQAVSQVFAGGAPMSANIANMVIKSFHVNTQSSLTDRETEVLRQLSQGKTYDYIAQALAISKDTVKTHIKHIYEKLQVNNKSDAVIKARKNNLV